MCTGHALYAHIWEKSCSTHRVLPCIGNGSAGSCCAQEQSNGGAIIGQVLKEGDLQKQQQSMKQVNDTLITTQSLHKASSAEKTNAELAVQVGLLKRHLPPPTHTHTHRQRTLFTHTDHESLCTSLAGAALGVSGT